MNNEYTITFRALGADQFSSDVKRMVQALEQMAASYESLLRKMQQSYKTAVSSMQHPSSASPLNQPLSGASVPTQGAGSLDAQLQNLNRAILELPSRMEAQMARSMGRAFSPSQAGSAMVAAGGVELGDVAAELNVAVRNLNEGALNLTKAGSALERMALTGRAGIPPGMEKQFEGTLKRLVEESGRSGMGVRFNPNARPPAMPTGIAAASPVAMSQYEARQAQFESQSGLYHRLEKVGLASGGYMMTDPRVSAALMNMAATTMDNPQAMPNRQGYYRMANVAATGANEDEILAAAMQGSGGGMHGGAGGGVGGLRSFFMYGGRRSHITSNLLQTGIFGAEAALGYGALNLLGTNFHNTLALQYSQASVDQLVKPGQRSQFNSGVNAASIRYNVAPGESYDVAFKMQATFGKTTDSLKATNAVLLLSRTSTIQLAQAMSDLVAITDSFQTGAKGMGDTVNGLIGIQNKYGVSTEQMVQALSRLGDLMHELGIDEAHAAAYVGVIQRSTGATGEQVASKIERVLPRFLDPGAQNVLATIGARHGIFDYGSFLGGSPNVQNLIQQIGEGYRSGKISKNEITQMGVALGQQRNMAFLAPLLEHPERISGQVSAWDNGIANNVAQKRYDVLKGTAELSLKGMEAAIQELAQQIAQSGLLQALTIMATVFKNIAAAAGSVLYILNEFTAALGPFGNALKAAFAGYLAVAGTRRVLRAAGSSGLGSALVGSSAVTSVRRLFSSEGIPEAVAMDRRAMAMQTLAMAAAGTAGPGFIAPSSGRPGDAYFNSMVGGTEARMGPTRSLYIPPIMALDNPGVMKAFAEGMKSTISVFGTLITRTKELALAFVMASQRFLVGLPGRIGLGSLGARFSFLGPAAEGEAATGLRGRIESAYAKRLIRGGTGAAEAGASAAALSGGEALSFLGGTAVPVIGALAIGGLFAKSIMNSMNKDRQADKDFRQAIQITNQQVAGYTTAGGGGIASAADTLEQAAQAGDTHANQGAWYRHLGRWVNQRNTKSSVTVDQALALGLTKKDLEKADIAIGKGDKAGYYRFHASAMGSGIESSLGIPNDGAQYWRGDQQMDTATAQKLSQALRRKEAAQEAKTFNRLKSKGLAGSLLPPELMTFLAGDIQSSYLYGGTSLDLMGTSSAGQPVVSSKKYTFKDYINRLGQNITALQAEIGDALKANNIQLAQQLEDTKNQMVAQKTQVLDQAAQARAALVGYHSSVVGAAYQNVVAAQNILSRTSDPNSPDAMQKKLALQQAQVAFVQSPYDLGMTASQTLAGLTPNMPSMSVKQLQQQANLAISRAQATLRMFGGDANNSVVQQAMTSAIQATSQALEAHNQAQLQAVQAAGQLQESQTRNPVKRAAIQLHTAEAVYRQTVTNANRENALASGSTGNPMVDKFIRDLREQATLQVKSQNDASGKLGGASDAMTKTAGLWDSVGHVFQTAVNGLLGWVERHTNGPGFIPGSGGTGNAGDVGPGPGQYNPKTGKVIGGSTAGATNYSFKNVSAGGLSLLRFMASIRKEESGGNYDWGLTSHSGAHGAYQFMPDTWLADAQKAGVNPNDHSKAAQDKVAAVAMTSSLRHYHGDWFKVAEAWYQGGGATDQGLNNKDPKTGLTAQQYAQMVLTIAGKPGMISASGSGTGKGGAGTPAAQQAAAAVYDAQYQLAQAPIEQFQAALLYQAGAASQPKQLKAEIEGLRAKIEVDKRFDDVTSMYKDLTQLAQDAYQLAQQRVQGFYDALQLRTDTSDPAVALNDQIKMLDHQMKAYLAHGGQKKDPSYIEMQLQRRNALRDKALALVQNHLQDEDYAFTMHQVGWEQHIQNLMKLRDSINTKTRAGKLLWEQINEEIQGLVDSLSGQFNLPDLGKFMPTVYEARRGAAGLSSGTYAQNQPIPISGSTLPGYSQYTATAANTASTKYNTSDYRNNYTNTNYVIINIHGGNTRKIVQELKAALNVDIGRWGSVSRKSW